MPYITLRNTGAHRALCSPEDEAFLNQWRWSKLKNGYAMREYRDESGKVRRVYMHRAVMERILGHPIPPGLTVDHIDRDRLNQQRDNLRLATRSQQQAHKGIQVNTARYKGVSWHLGKYDVRIQHQGRRLTIGRFEDAVTAALHYDAATRLLNGPFAGPNFPDIPTPSQVEAAVRRRLARSDALS